MCILAGLCYNPCVRTAEFDYDLPPDLIAQAPVDQRDRSRLLVLQRSPLCIGHHHFAELPSLLKSGDLLVINNSRVIAGRLRGVNSGTGGRFEILLLQEVDRNNWWTMIKPGRRATLGTEIRLLHRSGNVTKTTATTEEVNAEGHRRISFRHTTDIKDELERLGEIPLPPYIKRSRIGPQRDDAERYQTVFANDRGSLAAPTAGLHFTRELIARLVSHGIGLTEVTLHVGLGTFAPVKAENIADHVMHEEQYSVSPDAASRINQARQDKRRVIAVGTTSLRVLESVARSHGGRVVAGCGRTRIFIHPPSQFQVVDALVTNFHLPKSTLLMLVSAFAAPGEFRGREIMLEVYATAIRERYRFFSYGDAMLIS